MDTAAFTPQEAPQAPQAPPALRACLFSLAGSLFAVDVRSLREVAVFDNLTVVPLAPAHILGAANLRGTVMPIVDVRPLLGLPPQRAGRGELLTLVVKEGPVQAAVAVEVMLGLEPFGQVLPLESGPEGAPEPRQFGLGLLQWGEGLVTLLDAPRILQALRPGRRPGGGDTEPPPLAAEVGSGPA